MSWFLKDRLAAAGERITEGLSALIPDSAEQFAGAVRQTIIEGDRWNANAKARSALTEEMIEKLGGADVVSERYARENPATIGQVLRSGLPFSGDIYSSATRDPRNDPDAILAMAQDLMQKEPELWGDLPRDKASFDTTWKSRLAAERQELDDMGQRGDAPWTQFAGQMIGGFDDIDVVTAPLGGSVGKGAWGFAKFVMGEMAIGGLSEVPAVLKERAQAKRLGFEAGDAATQIGMAAVLNGALSGVIGGGVKAFDYVFTRKAGEAEALAGNGDPMDGVLATDAAEDALRKGELPPPPQPFKPDVRLPAVEDPAVLNVLKLIGRIEAPKGFDQVSDFTVIAPPRPVTQMTVDEVLAFQAQNIAAGAEASAIGGYQIKRSTLEGLKASMGLNGSEVFDEAMQSRMAVALMEGRGLSDWRAGKITDEDFANNLAQEWAALPVVTGPRAGQSYYGGDGLNNAQVAVGQAPASPGPGIEVSRLPEDVTVELDLDGKTRDEPVSDDFLGKLRGSVAPLGDGIGVRIVSGGQDPIGTPGGQRTGSTRHDVDHTGHSATADVVLTRDGKPVTPTEDPALYEAFLFEAAKVYPGIGHYDWGVHVGGGSVAAWGPDRSARTLDPKFAKAIAAGRQGADSYRASVGTDGDTFLGVLGGAPVSDSLQRASRSNAGAGGTTPPPGRRGTFETLFGEVSTPAGTKFRVEYEVIDASLLKPATGDLQPRDRSRAASDEQVNKIATRLDPARLMPGPESDRGAPIIGPDNIIESGNGRVLGIKRAREVNPDGFQGYVEAIRRAGFDVPDGMQTPVLVARRTDDFGFDKRVQVIRESNTSAIARMSTMEQAKFDADYLSQTAFDAYRPGQKLGGAPNAEFVRRMFATIPAEERSALMAAGGALSPEGRQRIRSALFARAFDADDLLKLAVETESSAVDNLIRMLEDVAPDWAYFRSMVDAGYIRREFDITEPLMDALRIIARARGEGRDGQSVIAAIRDKLAQGDMFAAPDPMVEAMIGVFYRGERARLPDASGDILRRYAAEAATIGRADAPELTDAVAPVDILGRAVQGEEGGAAMPTMPARPEPPEPDIDTMGFEPAPFTDGTDSPAVVRSDGDLQADLAIAESSAALSDLIRRGASAEDIEAHPMVADAIARAEQIEPTTNLPQYGTETFWQSRKYLAGDQELLGIDAALDYLHDASRKLGWTEDGLQPPAKIAKDRKAVILLGAPAAGKSSIANPFARNLNAAIIDGDEAKKLIPEFDGGLGAGAVHAESMFLADRLLLKAVVAGDNVIIPKVGGSPAGIRKVIDRLRAAGYKIDVQLVDVAPDESWRRMIGRFVKTGRLIPPKVLKDGIEGAPKTYELLKAEGYADGFAKIDNTPGLGQPRGIIEDSATFSPAFLGRDGGNGIAGNGTERSPMGEDAGGQGRDQDALTSPTEITLDISGDQVTRSTGDVAADIDAERGLEDTLNACTMITKGRAP